MVIEFTKELVDVFGEHFLDITIYNSKTPPPWSGRAASPAPARAPAAVETTDNFDGILRFARV